MENVRTMRAKYSPGDYGVTPVGNVNLSGYVAFHYAWQCVGIFQRIIGLRVKNAAKQWKYVSDGKEFGKMEDKTAGMGYDQTDRDIEFVEVNEGDMGTSELFEGGQLKGVIEPVGCLGSYDFDHFTSGLDYTPTTGGHLFPYFKGLVLASSDFVTSVMFRHFQRCLVSSEEAAAQLFPFLRIGLRSLHRTEEGKQLQHIFFGIQTAIETGGGLAILVENGMYHGFVLLGKDITIIDHGKVKDALSVEDLTKEIHDLDVHRITCHEIKKRVDDVAVTSGEKIVVDLIRLQSSSRYCNQVMVDVVQRTDDGLNRLNLANLVRKLRYSNKYWSVTEENLEIVLQAMTTGIWPQPMAPYCLDGDLWKSTNNLIQCLSVFGPTAPSIINGDFKFHISKPGQNDPNLTVVDKKRKLQVIPLYMKSVSKAAMDWNIVRTKKFLSMNGPKKGAPKNSFTDRSKAAAFVADKFDSVYGHIRTFAYAFDVQEPATGKKRAMIQDQAEGSGSGGGIQKKKKGNDRAVAMDFF